MKVYRLSHTRQLINRNRTSCLLLQRRFAQVRVETGSEDEGHQAAGKNESSMPAVVTPVSSNPSLATRLKTAASIAYDIVKSTAPSIPISVPSLPKSITRKLPFKTEEKSPSEVEGVSQNEESQQSLSSYIGTVSGKSKPGTEVIPRWKLKRKSVTQDSIDARTRHVMLALAKATSKASLLVRLEDFCRHVFQYPQAKCLAAKEGAVSMLLRLRHSAQVDTAVHKQINEALALLGYAEPLPGRGIRILSIDGGGTRGLLALRILKKIEDATQRPISQSFDYICGVSTGAILAVLLGIHRSGVDEVDALYREMSKEVFRQNRSSGWGSLLWSHSYYNTEKWEKILQDKVGEIPLIKSTREKGCPKISAVSTIVNGSNIKAYVFRNYTLPPRVQSQYAGSYRHRAWEAARASAAAPGYFSDFKLEDNIHQDGGLILNNPTGVAIHEAQCIWPDAYLQSVVSIGTGRCQPLDIAAHLDGGDPSSTSWRQKLVKVIESATDTERVHAIMHDLLPPRVYYRFNPYLSEVYGLDETDPNRLEKMLADVDMYLRKNQRKLDEASATLMKPRKMVHRLNDWIQLKRLLLRNTDF